MKKLIKIFIWVCFIALAVGIYTLLTWWLGLIGFTMVFVAVGLVALIVWCSWYTSRT
jgi:hypothetical protein